MNLTNLRYRASEKDYKEILRDEGIFYTYGHKVRFNKALDSKEKKLAKTKEGRQIKKLSNGFIISK